jgi:TRAP transporter TAXI family solute receptor
VPRRFNLLLLFLLGVSAVAAAGWLVLDLGRPQTLIVAAGSRNSEGFGLAEAIATVVRSHHPDVAVEVIETGGSLSSSRLLDEGYADLAIVQSDVRVSNRSRLVAVLYPDAYQLIARQSAGIETVADLEGKVVALPTRGSAQFTSFWQLAGHYGLHEDSVRGLPMSNRAAEWALLTGAVDAAFRVRAPGDQVITELVKRADIRLVPIEQAPALHLRNASIVPGRIPKGSYRGHPPLPDRDLPTASVDRLLVAAVDVPEPLVFAVAEVLFERRSELSERSPLATLIRAPDAGGGTTLPIHGGTVRYFERDKPSFFSEQADFLRTMLSLLAIFASMFFGFRNWFQGRQKARASAYNKDLMALLDRARTGELSSGDRRDALEAILVKVVDDLQSERIASDGFDEFSFTWDAVRRLLDETPLTPRTVDPA